MREVTKLVLVQFAVTLEIDDDEVIDILSCRGRVVGPGADLPDESSAWPVVVVAGEGWGSVGAFGECADQVLSHATPDLQGRLRGAPPGRVGWSMRPRLPHPPGGGVKAYRRELVVSLHGRCDDPEPEEARLDRATWRALARGVVASSWRQAKRAVDIIPPEHARVWGKQYRAQRPFGG